MILTPKIQTIVPCEKQDALLNGGYMISLTSMVFLSCDIVLMYEKHAATFVWSARRCNDSARMCLTNSTFTLHGQTSCLSAVQTLKHLLFNLIVSSRDGLQLVGLNSALYLPIELVSSLREMRCNLRVKERSMISEC
ncbi:hypothetical protein NC652_040461 [Populus alba x Populus x berolinensis]|nr:hypothetical protein NC652_040461 [Populus alba x Populus x berolinensis]